MFLVQGQRAQNDAHITWTLFKNLLDFYYHRTSKNGQDYVERPPLVEWGGWHLIAGGKDRESRALWKKITKLHEMPQEGPPSEVPINV